MDSVPYVFCRDVCRSLGLENSAYRELSGALTGRWKAASDQHAQNLTTITVQFGKDDVGWFYKMETSDGRLIKSPAELSRCSKRYTAIARVEVVLLPFWTNEPTRCLKDEIVVELAPLLRERLAPRFCLMVHHCPEDVALAAYQMFPSPFTVDALHIIFHCKESEDLVVAHLDNNPRIRRLVLSGFPHTTTLEDRILKLLRSASFQCFSLEYNFTIPFTLEMFKAFLDAWLQAEQSITQYLTAIGGGSRGVEPREILSIPVPPDVTRTVKDSPHLNKLSVLWTKANRWYLSVNCLSNGQRHTEGILPLTRFFIWSAQRS
uniref:FBD domain-containing protein n=1 Tax=Steinernema glaseri TaxID=37863 RepID=A0A1I7XZI4_9BILA